MRAVGLITEYNPFHNGHLHHLRESRRLAEADVAVAVMSGHFLQRGEPALLDKWVRAEMALKAGIDVVVEIPAPWACNSAPHFALGAVTTLDAFGGIDALCFGSESGDIALLDACARTLVDRGDDVARGTAELLRQGVNYPRARASVVGEMAETAVAATPNNILGIEYLSALRRTGSPMRPLTIPRVGAGYNDEEAVEGIASATGIRKMLGEGRDAAPYLPLPVREVLRRAVSGGACYDPQAFFRFLLARIFRGRDSLKGLYLVDDGIDRRLTDAADRAASLDELIEAVKSKQWTRTRIQRVLCSVFNEVTSSDMAAWLEAGPLYLHLLAASPRGEAFLAVTRKKRSIPLVGNYSRIHALLKRRYGTGTPLHRLAEGMLDMELRATRNYTLLLRDWSGNRNRDFFTDVVKPDNA